MRRPPSSPPPSIRDPAQGSRWARAADPALLAILALALALRLLHWWTVRDGPFVGQLVMDSQEYDRWALAIARGDWLGQGAFFQAPLYPYLLALVYRLVGEAARLDAVYLLQIAAAVGGTAAIALAGTRLAGRRQGLAAALLFALAGPAIFADVQLLKESLATTLSACFLAAAIGAATTRRPGAALAAGGTLGLVSLLRENALLLAPLFALWLGAARSGSRRRAALFVVGVALPFLPLLARNLLVTGEPLLTTYQGGVNFYIGNNPLADGTYRPLSPGRQIPRFERREPIRLAEEATGRSLTPAEVSHYWWHEALDWARREPSAFLHLQLHKLRLFWTFYEWPDAVDYAWLHDRSPALALAPVELGTLAILALAALPLLRSRWATWTPVLLFIGGWTGATILFFVFARYRLPIFPALALLGGVTLERVAAARGRRLAAWLPLLVLAVAIPRWAAPAPRLDLVHYNLGRLAEEGGDPVAAADHYRQALSAHPDHLLATMNLGTLAARRGALPEALDWYERAVSIEPGSPDAWANLGGALLASGRPAEAERALARALELDPTSLGATHNLALTYERLGRLAEAREQNRRVLEVAPDHPEAGRLAARLAASEASQ